MRNHKNISSLAAVKRLLLGYLPALFFLIGCELEISPYQVNHPEKPVMLNLQAIDKIIAQDAPDTLKIAVIADTQRFYDETNDFVDHYIDNSVIADFVIHVGDISDFGLLQEFIWMHEILQKLPDPYLVVVGNHDLLGNGDVIFEEMYGPLNFSFTWGNNKFIFLNSNSREFAFNGKVPDMDWLRNEFETAGHANIFLIMHAQPYSGDFDSALRDEFLQLMDDHDNLVVTLVGHGHNFREYIFGEDNLVLMCNSMNNRSYLEISFDGEIFDYEKIKF